MNPRAGDRAAGPRATLTTRRLVLTPLTEVHLPLLRALDGDPAVMRFIDRPRTAEASDAVWLPVIRAQTDPELGTWVGSLDGARVGWWSVTRREHRADEAEAGWRLLPRFWGAGLAREGAARLLDHAFADAGVTRVTAETMAVNAASRRVMAALGMRHVRTEVRAWPDPLPGSDLGEVITAITADQWRGREPR